MSDIEETISPTLQEIQSQIIDTLQQQHQTLPDEHEQVKTQLKRVMEFMSRDGIEIYNPKNTMEFYEVVADLASALSIVDLVVQNEQVVKYLLQAGISFSSIPEVPDTNKPKEKESEEGGNILSRFFQPKARPVRKTDPYEGAVSGFSEKLNKKKRLERFTEMHSHGIETFKIISNLPDDEVFDAMEDLKAIHVTVFPNDLGIHIVSIHSLYVKMEQDKEREKLLKVAVSNQRDLQRIEDQSRFMQQPPS